MAFTRELIQRELGGMNDAHLADTIANPSFDSTARRFGVEILVDRKSAHANRPDFALLVKSITDERDAIAAAAAEEQKALDPDVASE